MRLVSEFLEALKIVEAMRNNLRNLAYAQLQMDDDAYLEVNQKPRWPYGRSRIRIGICAETGKANLIESRDLDEIVGSFPIQIDSLKGDHSVVKANMVKKYTAKKAAAEKKGALYTEERRAQLLAELAKLPPSKDAR